MDDDGHALSDDIYFGTLHWHGVVLLYRNWDVVVDGMVDSNVGGDLNGDLDGHRLLDLNGIRFVHVDGVVFGNVDGVGSVHMNWVRLRDRDLDRPLDSDRVGLGYRNRDLSGDRNLGDGSPGTASQSTVSTVSTMSESAVTAAMTASETVVAVTKVVIETALLLHGGLVLFGEDGGGQEEGEDLTETTKNQK